MQVPMHMCALEVRGQLQVSFLKDILPIYLVFFSDNFSHWSGVYQILWTGWTANLGIHWLVFPTWITVSCCHVQLSNTFGV